MDGSSATKEPERAVVHRIERWGRSVDDVGPGAVPSLPVAAPPRGAVAQTPPVPPSASDTAMDENPSVPDPPPGRPSRTGPGWIVAAAFIGPGTVTTATLAGAAYGAALLWALLFGVLATMVLQEMAARLGLVTGLGLGEAVRRRFRTPVARGLAVALVVGAIAMGNAAYETGNLLGGALGLEGTVGGDVRLWALLIGGCGFALLWSGSYRAVERVMVGLVGVMSIAFVATAVRVLPQVDGLLSGLLVPSLPDGSLLVAVGLIGTTVVPYNLFLHANAAREKWPAAVPLDEALPAARRDSVLSIGLGGLITLAILSTAAVAFFGSDEAFDAFAMAQQLEPLLGAAAGPVFAAGLFAGGLTSALTAPLAAGYAVCGALGWRGGLRDRPFRAVSFAVLASGTLFAALGTRPLAAILFAQAANGLLLPFVALALLYLMNRKDLLGAHRNGPLGNLLGAIVVGVAMLLGLTKLASIAGLL